MKFKLLFIFFLLVFKQISSKETIDGYYINLKGDTVQANFVVAVTLVDKVIKFYKLQEGITYLDAENKKQHLSPSSAKEFVLYFNNDTIQFLSRYVDLTKFGGTLVEDQLFLFLKLEKNGYHKLFKFFADGGGDESPDGRYHPDVKYNINGKFDYCLQKGDEPVIGLGMLSKKQFSEYYFGYPELMKKIKDKVYKKEDIEKIVDEYNVWYEKYHFR
jgi:hypothetical protein